MIPTIRIPPKDKRLSSPTVESRWGLDRRERLSQLAHAARHGSGSEPPTPPGTPRKTHAISAWEGTRRARRIPKTFGPAYADDRRLRRGFVLHDQRVVPSPRGTQDTAAHDSRPEEQVAACALPEELVEALAGLLAQALINDIRQYPDLSGLTHSHLDPATIPPTTPPGVTLPKQSEGRRHTPTRSKTRRSAHAPSDQRTHAAS
jgi:hypothetical protein